MKYLLLCFCSCVSISLSAQQETDFKHLSTGIKIGTNAGLLMLEKSDDIGRTGVDLGYAIIVDFIEFRLNKKYGINLGIGFANRNYQQLMDNIITDNINGKALVKEYSRIQNIEVPLTFRHYRPKKKSAIQVYYSIGGRLNFNLFSESKQEIFFEESTWEFNRESNIRRTTYGAEVGIGFQYFTKYTLSYYIEPTLQISPNQLNFEYGKSSTALVNIGLLAGVKF